MTLLSAFGLASACLYTDEPDRPPEQKPPPCELISSHYRITDIEYPRTLSETSERAVDLDGDTLPDNGAVVLIISFVQWWDDGFELLDENFRTLTENDDLVWLVRLETCQDGSPEERDYLRVALDRGEPVPGTDRYRVVEATAPATGWRQSNGGVYASGGQGLVPVSVLADMMGLQRSISWVLGDGMAITAAQNQDGGLQGQFGLGLRGETRVVVGEVMADFYTEVLPTGRSDFAGELDANDDGIVTEVEFNDNSLVRSLMQPDVDLMAWHEGREVYWPTHDGVLDRLSLGLTFAAAPVVAE